jgi:hypothetical protein
VLVTDCVVELVKVALFVVDVACSVDEAIVKVTGSTTTPPSLVVVVVGSSIDVIDKAVVGAADTVVVAGRFAEVVHVVFDFFFLVVFGLLFFFGHLQALSYSVYGLVLLRWRMSSTQAEYSRHVFLP